MREKIGQAGMTPERLMQEVQADARVAAFPR
jgi:hypothetical protein